MRTKYYLIFLVSLALGLFCTASCTDLFQGKSIKFSGKTNPDRPQTKTSYSGQTFTDGDKTYERIDWVNNDMIVINMNNSGETQSKDFVISGVTTSGRYSNAGLNPFGEEGLFWGTGSHKFWAAYPSSAGSAYLRLYNNVPADQAVTYRTKTNNILYYSPNMEYAFMVASLVSDPVASVSLDFYPAVTTFEFTVGANDGTVVDGFTMETISSGVTTQNTLTGDAEVNFNETTLEPTFSASGTKGQEINVTFSQAASISPTTQMNFKVFAVPQDIKGVRIAFHIDDGSATGLTRSLNLTRETSSDPEWITFPARSLIRITGLLIPSAIWTITFDGPREEQWTIHPDIEISIE